MEYPRRKANRLPGYDYSQPGYYFVTVCVKKRRLLLWEKERRGAHCAPAQVRLPDIGCAVEHAVKAIECHYSNIRLDKYVIMPNHVHLISVLNAGVGRTMCAPTQGVSVSRVVRGMKEAVTKTLGRSIWQKGYHDHIIRNEADYLRIWSYIDTNPVKWREDCYYSEEGIYGAAI